MQKKKRVTCYFNPCFQDGFTTEKLEKLPAKDGKRKSASANDRKTLTFGASPRRYGAPVAIVLYYLNPDFV